MELDAEIKRANYIDKSVGICETFSFAEPVQMIQAVEKYCGDHYGGMLWAYDGEAAGQYFRCWHRCIKLVWNIPLACHNYIIDHLLAEGFSPIRHKILSRYVKFFSGLLTSCSPEVALIANLAGRDKSSTTGRNLELIAKETGLNPWSAAPASVREKLKLADVPQCDQWRLPVLKSFLDRRREMEYNMEKCDEITGWIDTLCIN